jgi:hypothetical protein
MARNIGAAIVGVFVAVGLVWAIESVGHGVYPPPASLDLTDAEAMRAYADAMPIGALLFVALAWFSGTLAGTWVACRIGTASPLVFVLVVGGLILTAAITNLMLIPHPLWFSALGIIAILVGAWLGKMLGGTREAPA